MFTVIYYVLIFTLYIVALPFLIIFILFNKKYRKTLPPRFFLFKNRALKPKGIWCHGCSFGEVASFTPIVNQLKDKTIHITTTTDTGIKEAKKLSNSYAFLPYELFLPFWIKSQDILIVTEAELWYMLFFVAKSKGAKTILINARVSDNSYKSYLKFSWFYKKIFANIDRVFAQSEKDRDRLIRLGAKNIVVNGNLKSANKIEVTKKYQKPTKEVVTLASTHEGEEEKILSLIEDFSNICLIIVPRHPQRFKKVDYFLKKFAKERELSYNKFSKTPKIESDITLVDTMGELINIYAISDFVILGGSFIDGIGGHNPIEPAFFGCKILSGEYYFNQFALYELVENIKVVKDKELKKTLNRLKNLKKTHIISKGEIEPIIKELN